MRRRNRAWRADLPHQRRRRPTILPLVAWTACCLYGNGRLAEAQSPKATITGGADASGQKYTWTVTNEYTSPIVYVEFPHYRAGLFFAPEGWSIETTGLVGVGDGKQQGVCSASVESPGAGIRPGETATYSMQIAPLATSRGRGTVYVRFADGTEARIAGVELPQRENVGDKYTPLIGLAAIFIIWVLVRAKGKAKRRRRVVSETSARGKP